MGGAGTRYRAKRATTHARHWQDEPDSRFEDDGHFFQDNFQDKHMTAVAERIFNDALDLLPVERAELIEKLFQSFDCAARNAVDAAWAEEVESRFDAYDRGEIKASSAEDVFARINQR